MINAMNFLEDSPSDELRALHKKREALVRVVKITQALERMLNGLQSALLLGRPSSKLSKHALRAYEQLGKNTAMLPTAQLKVQLDRLDKLVSGTLGKILEIASIDHHELEQHIGPHADNATSEDSMISRLIDNFRRSAQTAVALRILLRERGVSTPATDFKIPDTALNKQILQLEEREQQCRHQIEKSITDIQQTTQRIIDNESSSDEVRAIASMIQENLTRDLKHIRAGKSIDDMPMVIEVVELRDDNALPDEQVQENPETADTSDISAQERSQSSSGPGKRGFFTRLRVWGTTPMNVKWKDIDDQ